MMNKEKMASFKTKREELGLAILGLINEFENEHGGKNECAVFGFHMPPITKRSREDGKKYETMIFIDGKNFE